MHLLCCDRSPAIVMAYLMKSKGWKLAQSYQWVKEHRPSVELNEGLVKCFLAIIPVLISQGVFLAITAVTNVSNFLCISDVPQDRCIPAITGVRAKDFWLNREHHQYSHAQLSSPFSFGFSRPNDPPPAPAPAFFNTTATSIFHVPHLISLLRNSHLEPIRTHQTTRVSGC
ncbi:hypothetical protein BUALT_BualtUnG0059900 [Buddleja alternifolia]|uniref:Uncharacterized protein n=1 Tax=Buddleja alternifolia TaxID=168488 RepID=A0AAV6W0E8_9LAMI|nr:hypothetical protein BUALT_BualtUnG0059900 [Buddleja alternifolia]